MLRASTGPPRPDEFRRSLSDLQALKDQAVAAEDFDEAARLKEMIQLKAKSLQELMAMKAESVEREDFEGAAGLKELIEIKKAEQSGGPCLSQSGGGPSLEELMQMKAAAVAAQDFDEAQRLKQLIQQKGGPSSPRSLAGSLAGSQRSFADPAQGLAAHATPPELSIDELQRRRLAAVGRQDFAEAQRLSDLIDRNAPSKGPDAYKGREIIGKGAYGTVYKVRRRSDGAVLILKEPIGVEADTVKCEALVMEKLVHPHIVSLVDHFLEPARAPPAGSGNPEYIIVTEFCPGGDLRKFQDQHAKTQRCLSQEVALRIFKEMLDGVAFLHAQGVLHRDLKPDNILLMDRAGNTAKIADFGEAKAAMTAQTFRGTPCYMAPELISSRSYGAPNDVWACGCILYEMSRGKFAFDPRDPRAIFQGKVPKDAPAWCAKLVSAALQFEQKKRPTVKALLSQAKGERAGPR